MNEELQNKTLQTLKEIHIESKKQSKHLHAIYQIQMVLFILFVIGFIYAILAR
jgi:Ni,Fe-hydrogenase I cytochrome b subunit